MDRGLLPNGRKEMPSRYLLYWNDLYSHSQRMPRPTDLERRSGPMRSSKQHLSHWNLLQWILMHAIQRM
jgi:hypothetical protein